MAGRTTTISFVFLLIGLHTVTGAFGFGGGNDKVRLEDVKVLTLHNNKMTTGRRSSPVPQLKCVGGTAGCSAFKPQVVQCYNRGSDGYDVQWECKTDMDNAYRFGSVEVICEGYDYQDDPYILKGSCGLEYTIDLTKEGYQQQQQGHHDYYGQQHHYQGSHDYGYTGSHSGFSKKAGSVMGDLIVLGIVAIIIYAIYKTCLASNNNHYPDGGDQDRGNNRFGSERRPPPPGFRDEYMSGDGCSSSHSGQSTHTGATGGPSTGTGNFWTGAATGGILGYLFGSRNNYGSRTYASPYNAGWGNRWGNGWGNNWGTGWGNNWGTGWGSTPRQSTGFFSSSSSGRSSGSSSGTRTASGFGGTRRR